MKTLSLKEMMLASFREKKARRVTFHPSVTVVRGNNETGKSSLIKSIFRAFGAEPAKVHPNWLDADVRSVIRFELDGEAFALLRYGGLFAAFDSEGKLIGRYKSVTKDLAPFLSRLFGFGLRLPDRDGESVALPPAYYFLPFYMDQDASWSGSWAGFARLGQFPDWKRGVIEYHAGIKGNNFYEAQAAKLEGEKDLRQVRRRREGMQEIYSDLGRRYEAARFNVDFSAYKSEVEELLKQCDGLREREEDFKKRISDLRNQRQALKTQLDITVHARDESRRDYEYATSEIGEAVQCPTCGAAYANSFAERFAIAVDEDHCAGLALKLLEELAKIDAKIEEEVEVSKEISDELTSIERLLAKREGEIALGDLIQQEGRKELREVMSSDIAALSGKEKQLETTVSSSLLRMKQLESRELRKEVNGFYEGLMRNFLNELDVRSVPDSAVVRVDAVIRDTGSELPRALLAYQMAMVHVVGKFGSAAFAPLVIDSPNQQDQDERHLDRILHFINNRKPSHCQLVLGLVDTSGVDFGGSEIILDRKHSLLSEQEFQLVGDEVQSFVDGALEN